MAAQYDRATPEEGNVAQRHGLLPLATYDNGRTGLAFPGFVAEPVQSFNRLLENGYTPGDTQGVEDAFNVAGAAMLGGFAAPKPRGVVGSSGGELRAAKSSAEPRTISALAEEQRPAMPSNYTSPMESTLTAYHGSPNVFTTFEDGVTPWFSTNKRTAESFALDRAAPDLYPNERASWKLMNPDKLHLYESQIGGRIKDVDPWNEASLAAETANIPRPRTWDDVGGVLDWATWQKGQIDDAKRNGFDAVRFRNVGDDPGGAASDHIAVTNNDAIKKFTQLYANGGRPGAATGAALGAIPDTPGIRAWHASPYEFDKPNTSKMGSGEGFQAFGNGFYTAESPAVSGKDGAYYNQFKNSHGSAHAYELNIKADPSDFLNWDAPLSQQSDKVKRAIESYASKDRRTDWGTWEDSQPVSYYLPAANARAIDMGYALKDQGVAGISYFDQGSRVAGEGSRNHVVFPDADGGYSLIEILRKYGLLGMAGGAAAAEYGLGAPQSRPASPQYRPGDA
jgi:hypothetical protein